MRDPRDTRQEATPKQGGKGKQRGRDEPELGQRPADKPRAARFRQAGGAPCLALLAWTSDGGGGAACPAGRGGPLFEFPANPALPGCPGPVRVYSAYSTITRTHIRYDIRTRTAALCRCRQRPCRRAYRTLSVRIPLSPSTSIRLCCRSHFPEKTTYCTRTSTLSVPYEYQEVAYRRCCVPKKLRRSLGTRHSAHSTGRPAACASHISCRRLQVTVPVSSG